MEALLSLIVSHSQEEANGKRTLAMHDISRAHVHGVPVRRVFMKLSDGEKESLARENGRVNYLSLDRPDLSFAAGSLPRMMTMKMSGS